jgi:hypothetical protein
MFDSFKERTDQFAQRVIHDRIGGTSTYHFPTQKFSMLVSKCADFEPLHDLLVVPGIKFHHLTVNSDGRIELEVDKEHGMFQIEES